MPKILLNVEHVIALHKNGKASQVHGVFDNGLLKAAVYGANDGIITTFAVVAGVAGAGLSPAVILILGISNMIADGLSMGIGDYLGERSQRRHLEYQYLIEQWEVEKIPDEEKKELITLFAKRGVSESDIETLIGVITRYPALWSELGFIEEMGVKPDFRGAIWHTGVMTFIAFVLAGSLPLFPYFLEFLGFPIAMEAQFGLSIVATAIALFGVGSLRTLLTKGRWWANGLEVLCIGTIAAFSAYLLGSVVERMVR